MNVSPKGKPHFHRRPTQKPRLRDIPIYLYLSLGERPHFAHCGGCFSYAHNPLLFKEEVEEARRWASLSEEERWEEIKCHKGCHHLGAEADVKGWAEKHKQLHTVAGKSRGLIILRRGER